MILNYSKKLNKKYKLNKTFFSIALSSSLITTSCMKIPQGNYRLQFREKEYTSFMLNPLDWSFDPDIVSMEVNSDNNIRVEMSIKEFEEMLNNNEEYITIEKDENKVKVNTKELREYSKKVLSNTTSKEATYQAKIIMIIAESFIAIICGFTIYIIADEVNKKIKKLRRKWI